MTNNNMLNLEVF